MRRRLRRELQKLERTARRTLLAPDSEALHRLRRRVKRAGLMQRLLGVEPRRGSGSPPLMSLARRLGADHDRALLLEEMRDARLTPADAALRDWIAAVHARSRSRLLAALQAAFAPGRPPRKPRSRPPIVG